MLLEFRFAREAGAGEQKAGVRENVRDNLPISVSFSFLFFQGLSGQGEDGVGRARSQWG